MTEIHLITRDHPLWRETISLAKNCSWRAGPMLAERMERDAFQDWERVCCATVGDQVAGFCTFCERDELPEDQLFTPFIGFVFVEEPYRGNRISQQMIRRVLRYAGELGYEKVYLMSGERGLYEKYGFVKLGELETVYGTTDQLFVGSTGQD